MQGVYKMRKAQKCMWQRTRTTPAAWDCSPATAAEPSSELVGSGTPCRQDRCAQGVIATAGLPLLWAEPLLCGAPFGGQEGNRSPSPAPSGLFLRALHRVPG